MKKIIFLVLLMLGCVTTERFKKDFDKFIGKDNVEVVRELGAPTTEINISENRVAYGYDFFEDTLVLTSPQTNSINIIQRTCRVTFIFEKIRWCKFGKALTMCDPKGTYDDKEIVYEKICMEVVYQGNYCKK